MFLNFRCAGALVYVTALAANAAESVTINPDSRNWPRLFGPTGDSVVPNQPLDLKRIEAKLPVLWELEVGESYTTPSIVDNRLILFHRIEDQETVDCLDVETRERHWRFQYPTRYIDRYGYNNGPRSTPIIVDEVVYTLGAEGKLHALRLEDGKKLWSRWLNREFKVDQDFFGVGGSPCIDENRLIINVGGTETDAGIVAIDRTSGETLWQATSEGPSYATPVAATIHGKRFAFVFTKGGLVSLEAETGKVLWSIPFRSRLHESVNASSPIVVGDIVFASATYGTGSLAVRIKPDGTAEELWRSVMAMDSHFSNLMAVDGVVFGFAGRHEGDAELRCIELETGKIRWSVPSVLGRGSMIRVGKEFLLWGERGHLFVRSLDPSVPPKLPEDPREAEPLLRYPCWTPPSIAAGRLYLRNETRMICFDLNPN
ncbi:PQQ-like beta-propeller repeat protein [bacterium]|nr:PQQ-like beta-propeller repeat protein [bacterium]